MSSTTSPASVRVRFAPSPTGYLHVGSARTLLFNWLYAQKTGGTLVLRIEDTDQVRSTREFEKMVLSDIARLGIKYAEGVGSPLPEGGPHAPYRQSERMDVYSTHARKLLDEDKAYYCFCTDEEITKKREVALKLGRAPIYDGTCARLTRSDGEARIARGEKAGLRFRSPHRSFHLKDHVRGEIEFKDGTVGDFYITRTPTEAERARAGGIGMPVYNFSCVVDDHLMGITHVIRGEDHLSNTARQLMIYDAFGWKTPDFAHIAMVLGADRQKLSKRNGDVSVFEYLDKGYFPEALLNFLSLLGWSPPAGLKPKSGHPEVLSREELVAAFSLDGLLKPPGTFDLQKLRWMNSHYLHHLALSDVCARAKPFFEKAGFALRSDAWFEGVVATVRGECALLSDLPVAAELFFAKTPALDEEARATVAAEPLARAVVDKLVDVLEAHPGEEITAADVAAMQKSVGESAGAKGKSLFMPLRAVITGKTHGPELKLILPLLGREAVLKRIKDLRVQAKI